MATWVACLVLQAAAGSDGRTVARSAEPRWETRIA